MLSPGFKIGPFEILSALGAGGMGEVYRARDTRLRREIAIKVLPAEFTTDPARLRRFELEARATGMLNHPNILTVFEIGVDQGIPYMATELLEGQNLRQRISGDPIPLARALDFARQIARGLSAAHERGIVHRDIKPDNLFVGRDGNVKILDFGLAKLTPKGDETTMEINTMAGQLLGTAAYMSPEQVRGRAVDYRSDIFSFGLVLYELVSGRRPFQAESMAEIMAGIASHDAPPLNVPPALDSLIRRCLEKDPQDRFQSAKDLEFSLQCLSSQALSPSGLSAPAILPANTKRVGIGIAAGIAVVVAAAALGAGLFFGHKPAAAPVYRQITYRRGTVYTARFASDGQTIVYSARWDAQPVDTFAVRREYPESRPLGLASQLLAVSPAGELAILREPRYLRHYQWSGTLAVSPLGGGSPRDLLDRVVDADYARDGRVAAVIQNGGSYRVEFPPGKSIYETQAWITHLRVAPKGDRVAFLEHRIANDDQGAVVALDLSGRRTVLSDGWTGAAEGLAWNVAGDEVWFSASKEGAASLAIYAVSLSGAVRQIVGGAQSLILQDIAHDGRLLIATQSYRTEVRVAAAGGRQERDMSWLEGSNFPFLSADGRRLLFSEEAAPSGYTVCLRATDGSPVVQLGAGTPSGFSPDGKWALVLDASTPRQLVLLPTGAGLARTLPRGAVESFGQSGWFPDGQRVLFVGNEPGKGRRAWLQDVSGGGPQPALPEGVIPAPRVISPDGKNVPCRVAGSGGEQNWALCSLTGGEPRPLPGLPVSEIPVRWTPDGKYLYTYFPNSLPWRVMKVSVADGTRQPWKEVIPSDPVGLDWLLGVDITPSGEYLSYAFLRQLNGLFIVDGVK